MINFVQSDEFLHELESASEKIIQEVEAFDKKINELRTSNSIISYYNKKNTVGNVSGWNQVRFICQNMPFLKFVERHQFTDSNESPDRVELNKFIENYQRLYRDAFPITHAILNDFHNRHITKLTNISIYRLAPDTVIPVHTNFDPHMYRCHMGLIIPDGDVGLMVEGEVCQWSVGKFISFDTTRPHTVWNKTNYSRYVLSVDCYRSNINSRDAIAVHRALVNLRMNESKLSLGLSGGRYELSDDIKTRYASKYEKHTA